MIKLDRDLLDYLIYLKIKICVKFILVINLKNFVLCMRNILIGFNNKKY